jgi:hypothetical protein
MNPPFRLSRMMRALLDGRASKFRDKGDPCAMCIAIIKAVEFYISPLAAEGPNLQHNL